MSHTPTENLQEQGRTKKGQFAKGHVQNPKGRIRGSKNKATAAALSLLDGQAEALTQKAVELALDGDVTALRLCLERIVSPTKERPLPPLKLPIVNSAQDLPKLTQIILEFLASGKLLPSQAAALSVLVANHAKALELAQQEKNAHFEEETVPHTTPTAEIRILDTYRRAIMGEFEE